MTDRDLKTVQREGVRLLKRYLQASEHDRTPLLRQIAEILVEARGQFTRPDGSPDWKGRSHPYRMWVREAFTEAGVLKDDQAAVQAAIRYHVGVVLREVLDEETREEYGLIPRSPKERSQDRRESRTALLQALTSRDIAGGALVALSAAQAVFSKIEPKDFDDLDGHAAEVADAVLADLERRVKAYRRRLAKA